MRTVTVARLLEDAARSIEAYKAPSMAEQERERLVQLAFRVRSLSASESTEAIRVEDDRRAILTLAATGQLSENTERALRCFAAAARPAALFSAHGKANECIAFGCRDNAHCVA